jgi:hypothetical protein
MREEQMEQLTEELGTRPDLDLAGNLLRPSIPHEQMPNVGRNITLSESKSIESWSAMWKTWIQSKRTLNVNCPTSRGRACVRSGWKDIHFGEYSFRVEATLTVRNQMAKIFDCQKLYVVNKTPSNLESFRHWRGQFTREFVA